jgi:hypothetical protein
MACILGSDAVKKKREEVKETEDNTKTDSASNSVFEEFKQEEGGNAISVGEVEKTHGLVTINSGSIEDYFASKMAAMKKARSVAADAQGRDSPIFLQFFYLFSKLLLNCF